MKYKLQSGFTLVEMLIVIAIIAILAGIIFVGVPGFRNNAMDSRRIADMRNVQNALELYYNKCRVYPNPADTSGACPLNPANGDLTWAQLTATLVGANIGISSLPQEPVVGWPLYKYTVLSEGAGTAQKYVLQATLTAQRDVLKDTGVITGAQGGLTCNTSSFEFCIGPK